MFFYKIRPSAHPSADALATARKAVADDPLALTVDDVRQIAALEGDTAAQAAEDRHLQAALERDVRALLAEAEGKTKVTQADASLAAFVNGFIRWSFHSLGPRDERVEALEKRVAALTDRLAATEAKSAEALDYLGVWQPGAYRKGAVVTWGGHLWIARRLTSVKPGESAVEKSGWSLAVRRGSDGRDGKDGSK